MIVKVSVLEYWTRLYTVEADRVEDAIAMVRRVMDEEEENPNVVMHEPQYLEDARDRSDYIEAYVDGGVKHD